MLEERPDNAATADTLKTMKFFIPGVNTWYGSSPHLVFVFLRLISFENIGLPTSGNEASWPSRSSEGPKSSDGRLERSSWLQLFDEDRTRVEGFAVQSKAFLEMIAVGLVCRAKK